jgi:glucokinase
MKNVVIDMGGTRIKLALFVENKLTAQKIIPAHAQEKIIRTLDAIEKEIIAFREESRISAIDCIAFSMPGIVDVKENRILSINEKYTDGVGFDFAAWAKEKFRAKVCMENDARACLVGEWQMGAGKGFDNLVMITLGTGIGGAALMEKKLLHGKHYQAGCLGGHFTIDFQGEMCNCGNVGCVESIASSWSLPQLAQKKGFHCENVDYETVCKAAIAGDAVAGNLLKTCIDAWSACAVNLIHAYDPEMVIIGGGVMKSADLILPGIREWVNRHAWTPWGKVRVEKAALGDEAALYGMNRLIASCNS